MIQIWGTYIQQIYSDTYDVYDENGNPKYFVKNEIVALLHRIHVSDMQGNEIGIIKENFILLLGRYLCNRYFKSGG